MTEATTLNSENQTHASRHYWDEQAASFDNEPDHGLRDPIILGAWTELLKTCLPSAKAKILDIGCGTGSLSTILAGLGYDVTGIDVSTAMISLAETKVAAAGHQARFHVMDAAYPQLSPQQFDAIVCRHFLWALSNPAEVLQRWVRLLKREGRLVLIEGYWRTGAGLHAREIVEALPPSLTNISVHALNDQPRFWGGAVEDERYLIIADLCL